MDISNLKSTMTVRGGKNRVLIYTGAGLLIVALVLFYHNAATKLDDLRTKNEKCVLEAESLSSQLQVVLDYKSRLEKSLQQEKQVLARTKEEAQNDAERARQTREKENLESINKFTALQQQYKLLQSQHEDVTQELDKAKLELLAAEERRAHYDEQVSSLTRQLKLLQDDRNSDKTLLQGKISRLEAENEELKKKSNASELLREKMDLQRELTECLKNSRNQKSTKKTPGQVDLPLTAVVQKSSTAANRVEVNSGAAVYIKASTPLINPDAVQSQDRTSPGTPLKKVLVLPEYNQQPAKDVGAEKPQPQVPVAAPPANDMNQLHFQYEENEADLRKEEDDDMDQIDEVDKGADQAQAPPAKQIVVVPHDSVMIIPK